MSSKSPAAKMVLNLEDILKVKPVDLEKSIIAEEVKQIKKSDEVTE